MQRIDILVAVDVSPRIEMTSEREVAERRHLDLRYRGYGHSAFEMRSIPWTYVHVY